MSIKDSIIFKTSLILGGTITILLALLGVFFVMSEKAFISEIQQRSLSDMEKKLEERKSDELNAMQSYLEFVAKTVGNVSSEYIYNVDEDGLKAQLKNFLNIKEVVAIDVADNVSGKTFVAGWVDGDVKFGQKLPESVTSKSLKKIEADAKYQQNSVGRVTIYYTDEIILGKIEKMKSDVQKEYLEEKDRIDTKLAGTTTIQIVAMVAIVAILVFASVLLLKTMVKRPLEVLKQAMVDLVNKKGSAADYIDIFTDDEIGEVAKYFNRYITKIVYGSEVDSTLIGNAVQVVEKVKAGHLANRLNEDRENEAMYRLQVVVNDMLESLQKYVQEIVLTLKSYSNDDYTKRSDRGAIEGEFGELIDGVNMLGESLSKMIAVNLKNGLSLEEDSKNLSETSRKLANTFEQQSQMLRRTTEQLQRMTDELQSNSLKIDAMTTHAQDMKAIIGIIGDIADQTNLLALNAAIEAARAGEHGRGFAVVSDEVRKLAEKTQKSLSEINVSINGLIQSVEEVAETFKEQAKGIENINDTINSIDAMTVENSNATNSVSKISKDINEMAENLVKDSKSKKFTSPKDLDTFHKSTKTIVEIKGEKQRDISRESAS